MYCSIILDESVIIRSEICSSVRNFRYSTCFLFAVAILDRFISCFVILHIFSAFPPPRLPSLVLSLHLPYYISSYFSNILNIIVGFSLFFFVFLLLFWRCSYFSVHNPLLREFESFSISSFCCCCCYHLLRILSLFTYKTAIYAEKHYKRFITFHRQFRINLY